MGMTKPTLSSALLSALILASAGTACHSDKRQASLPAPQANAPTLAPVLAALPQAIPEAQPVQPQGDQVKTDPVADLIASAEKDYRVRSEEHTSELQSQS